MDTLTIRHALQQSQGVRAGRAVCGAVWHPQAKTKCPRLEFSNEMQMDYVLSQV